MSVTEYPVRPFADDAAVIRIGEGLLAQTLPRADWTHEAHLAATCWLLAHRPAIALEAELPGIIRNYNVSVGGVNDDQQGYHETLTQLYIAGVRAHIGEATLAAPLVAVVNALLGSPRGRRDWPLGFYSPERLFSVPARRYFVAPDRCAFSDSSAGTGCRPRVAPIFLEELDHGNA